MLKHFRPLKFSTKKIKVGGVKIGKKEANLSAKIDWLQMIVYDIDIDKLCSDILGIDKELFSVTESRMKFKEYDSCYSYGSIKFYTQETSKSEFLVALSGEACTLFEFLLEKLERDWQMFFHYILTRYSHNLKITRLDLAIDDRNETPYFKIEQLIKKCKRGEYESRNRKFTIHESKYRGKETAKTLNIGSRGSALMFRIYEKDKEQAIKTNQAVEEIGQWTRLELELKNETATDVCDMIANSNYTILDIGRGIVKNELIFFSNGNLNTVARFWERYLGSVREIKTSRADNHSSLRDTFDWLVNGGALSAYVLFQMLSKEKVLAEDMDIESCSENAQFTRQLADKAIDYVVSVNRSDLVTRINDNTKKD